MIVTFDKLEPRGDRTEFHWTLTGTYAGTGNHVRISGYELWKIDTDGLIAKSKGHFDAAEYERQLKARDVRKLQRRDSSSRLFFASPPLADL